MLDARSANGVVKPGFMPQLESVLGAGSFDRGHENTRFAHLLSTDSRLGRALARHWSDLQAEMDGTPDGVLRPDASGAGAGSVHLQREITQQREALRFHALDAQIRALPVTDRRRQAWLNLDSFSTVWVGCWPSEEAYLTNAEFGEVAARYMGLPSPACNMKAGETIAGTRQALDRYGFKLSALPLAGDGWREQHDGLKWQISHDAKEMGVAARTEVYGLFAACIPQHGRSRFDSLPLRKRQGLVPDLRAVMQWDGRGPERAMLLEVKTLHVGDSTYPAQPVQRCAAVARRADALPSEYAAKARKVDSDYCGTTAGAVGPAVTLLSKL
jgi:hypothetical protein